jgi:hypothetical protein
MIHLQMSQRSLSGTSVCQTLAHNGYVLAAKVRGQRMQLTRALWDGRKKLNARKQWHRISCRRPSETACPFLGLLRGCQCGGGRLWLEEAKCKSDQAADLLRH